MHYRRDAPGTAAWIVPDGLQLARVSAAAVVVPVVAWRRRYPPLDLYIWDDKGVWLAEIFFRV